MNGEAEQALRTNDGDLEPRFLLLLDARKNPQPALLNLDILAIFVKVIPVVLAREIAGRGGAATRNLEEREEGEQVQADGKEEYAPGRMS